MKIDPRVITILVYLPFFFSSCNSNNPTSMPAMSTQTTTVLSQGVSTPTTSTASTPAGTDRLTEMAREDLAQRLSISMTQIKLVEITEAEWSDSSLDCPEPGMAYLQVITPGYRIRLEANGIQYEYHTNRDTYIVFCDNSTTFFPPKP